MRLLSLIIVISVLISCSKSGSDLVEETLPEIENPYLYDSAASLIGTKWMVHVFFNSLGEDYRSDESSEWTVTFESQSDFGAQAEMMIQFPCTIHSIPFTLKDGLFTAVTGLGSFTPDPCDIDEPNEAIIDIDQMFTKGKEYSYQIIDEITIQISSVENDALILRLK